MDLKSRWRKCVDSGQIKALIWKDVLVRLRQPWLTAIQFIWPCLIFVALYALRMKFGAVDIEDCQFPTRLLPGKTTVLPFFQSYICTIDNSCSNTSKYNEISEFEDAPVTPVVNIVQTFLNEDRLYHAIVDLPENMNFLGTITTIATHPKFTVLEENIGRIMEFVNLRGSPVNGNFDVKNLWSDDMTFSESGKLLCGKPFPRSNNIRFVDRVFYQEDFNGANQDEVNTMPTKYCKQLYLDVTNTNNGKITWNYIKPIVQGKIIYGPVNDQTNRIMMNANDTLVAMNRLKSLMKGLDETIKLLRKEGEFKEKFLNLVKLTKSSFVQGLLKSFKIDSALLDGLFNALLYDKQVGDVVETVANIFECFSVDRFVGVSSEREMEDLAIQLNEKKLFLAAIYFKNDGRGDGASDAEFAYELRMDVDNTPVTLENRNRFWFPGPDGNFELQMRYHRGFIQIQHIIDQAITMTIVQAENAHREELWKESTTIESMTTEEPELTEASAPKEKEEEKEEDDEDDSTTTSTTTTTTTTESPKIETEQITDKISEESNANESSTSNATEAKMTDEARKSDEQSEPLVESTSASSPNISTIISQIIANQAGNDGEPPVIRVKMSDQMMHEVFNIEDEHTRPAVANTGEVQSRKKRSPQFDFSSIFGSSSSNQKAKFTDGISMPDVEIHTKQFPYPKYRKDSFVTGLYLAQSVQLAFFFALIIQVSISVRHRIWMRESGNSVLMKIMGLKKSSENISWVATTLFEMAIVFLCCEVILYAGGILQTTDPILLYFFLLMFAFCVIAFCYMISSFFASASIGSASAVILFLMTYMPYIVIIALGTTLSSFSKFLANLSISTAFCYAWHYVMRLELQQRPLTFANAFDGSLATNDFKLGLLMIVFDIVLYVIIGYLYERLTYDEFKFHKVPTKDMDISIGGALHNCTKSYDDSDCKAIENVSIVFRRDFITCLLGRNGAGKSTIIKLLTGQISPNSGNVFRPQNWDRITGNEYDERIGLCPQNNILIPNLTAREHLELYVRIKSNDRFPTREVERVMRNLQFGKHEHFYSQNLSGGFKRRLNVAIAFIASPNMVILDEPCSGVDTKARKNIWELISLLRRGRAVVLATHYLDEAEHLSDSILIMNEGKIVAEHDPDSLKDKFTRSFELKIQVDEQDKSNTIEKVRSLLQTYAPNSTGFEVSNDTIDVQVPYKNEKTECENYSPLIKEIETLKREKLIRSFRVSSTNLGQIFQKLVVKPLHQQPMNGASAAVVHRREEKIVPIVQREKLTELEVMKNLLWKRFLHFKRNYRLILCVLVLPTLFEIIAMGFMMLRPPGEHDVNLQFSRNLYPNSTEFYSIENGNDFDERAFSQLHSHCDASQVDKFGNNCELFNSSESAFRWILDSHSHYTESRYGGVSINDNQFAVWYNNKGYHAMPVYLNHLNTALLRATMNNSDYAIVTNNFPLKLGDKELTTSSILQQVADAGISLILLVAFSLVIAGASIYIVNERINGEKLQQKLCDVSFRTYWGVAFIWDFAIFILALILAVVVFKVFDIPVYTAKHNLYGIVMLLLLFGFATIPMVHLCEKLFNDASLANMYILCLNVIIALVTITVIILFDILGESDLSEKMRDFLNRAFLIFPQHALADGLVEICKNHILADVFERYYINTYKSPVTSDLLLPHYSALIVLSIVFIGINYIVESGQWRNWMNHAQKRNEHDLEAISTSQSNGIVTNDTKKPNANHFIGEAQANAMKVENLSKTYDGNHQALRNVSFNVKTGECFGLLGANGAGKSTVFGILSGQLMPSAGNVCISNREAGISYCPQTNALDSLLTVDEIIRFYGKLRRIQNIDEILEQTLESFHLTPYRLVLTKNLSGGNRRKLSVAVTCFGSTSNVLMDEPTSDMDPVTRSIVYAAIGRLLYDKRSVILTSHTITEIDRVCGRIGVLQKGQMIAIASPQQLKQTYGNCYIVTVYYDHIEALTIEREIKKLIPMQENLVIHNNCLQFRVQIKAQSVENNNNDELKMSEIGGTTFSDLFNRLHSLTVGRGILYTITECLLDQAFDRVVEENEYQYAHSNAAYQQSETPT